MLEETKPLAWRQHNCWLGVLTKVGVQYVDAIAFVIDYLIPRTMTGLAPQGAVSNRFNF